MNSKIHGVAANVALIWVLVTHDNYAENINVIVISDINFLFTFKMLLRIKFNIFFLCSIPFLIVIKLKHVTEQSRYNPEDDKNLKWDNKKIQIV